MAQSGLFYKYIWLVDLIYRNDGITRAEINDKWYHSSYNVNKEREIPERNFHRYKQAVKELFDIEIVCNRSAGMTYHIKDNGNIYGENAREWLLNTFAINNLINESQDIKHRILFEKIPSGQRFLSPIIEAMQVNRVIKITYQSFRKESPREIEVEPYCVKVYKQRWYMLARRTEDGNLRTYGLDRIIAVEKLSMYFTLPNDFDAEQYFRESVGIIVTDNIKPQHVVILARNGQQNYIRSLPLHHSQEEVLTRDDASQFTYYVAPNYDLVQELLRYGDDVEVLYPKWFREEFKKVARNMLKMYNK